MLNLQLFGLPFDRIPYGKVLPALKKFFRKISRINQLQR